MRFVAKKYNKMNIFLLIAMTVVISCYALLFLLNVLFGISGMALDFWRFISNISEMAGSCAFVFGALAVIGLWKKNSSWWKTTLFISLFWLSGTVYYGNGGFLNIHEGLYSGALWLILFGIVFSVYYSWTQLKGSNSSH